LPTRILGQKIFFGVTNGPLYPQKQPTPTAYKEDRKTGERFASEMLEK